MGTPNGHPGAPWATQDRSGAEEAQRRHGERISAACAQSIGGGEGENRWQYPGAPGGHPPKLIGAHENPSVKHCSGKQFQF